MAYTPANALTVLDTAIANLRTESDAALAGGAPALAAMLEQAASRVQAGRERVAGAVASNAWTADRAVTALTAQSVPARADAGRAIVELPAGGRLIVEPFAIAVPDSPRAGYAISILGPSGLLATRLRAADDAALANIVGRLYAGAS